MKRYILLHTAIRTNPKVLGLGSDSARWAYVQSLLAAQETDPSGEWLDDTYYAAAVGPETAGYLPELLESTLLVRRDDGTIAVPQWAKWQNSRIPSADLAGDEALVRRREADRLRQARHRRGMSRDSHAEREEKERFRHDRDETPRPENDCARCGGALTTTNAIAVRDGTTWVLRHREDCRRGAASLPPSDA